MAILFGNIERKSLNTRSIPVHNPHQYLKGGSHYENISLNIDNETIIDDKVISNHFNEFFSSVAGTLVKKYQTQLKPSIHT